MSESLNVIALVSGGKDSFYSLLHCIQNGHKVVALGNLYPAPTVFPDQGAEDNDEHDLNSFMYQTVGHTVIPLYEQALGIPLYRQQIIGTAVQTELSYGHAAEDPGIQKDEKLGCGAEQDETESLVPLLKRIMAAHPTANALSTGAILSTYQRTRIESVALRLGLVPLAYLWQYPILPPATQSSLLSDMQDVGLDARIVKVASGGLDEDFLWANVADPVVIHRINKSMKRFGMDGDGAALGEGGEFETLVIDGPVSLFKGRIEVREEARRVVREGGGSAWLRILDASVVMKESMKTEVICRVPALLEPRFESILATIPVIDNGNSCDKDTVVPEPALHELAQTMSLAPDNIYCHEGVQEAEEGILHWTVKEEASIDQTISQEAAKLVEQIRLLLHQISSQPTAIISTLIILRSMTDFANVNKIYGALFTHPNPPARVTISCGSCLPKDINIVIHLRVQRENLLLPPRKALHVQSRSYWAPANIGPYSQAISTPLPLLDSCDTRDWGTSVAGQIPLVPFTMTLPQETIGKALIQSEDSSMGDFNLQAMLSLQHLWRIGLQMNVQWWTSIVAYLPPTSHHLLAQKVDIASAAWSHLHSYENPDDNMDSYDERDLWEEKYFAGMENRGGSANEKKLPDWEIIEGQTETPGIAPPFFAAEVEELPRGAGVEWAPYMGIGGKSIRLYTSQHPSRFCIHQCVTTSTVYSVVAVEQVDSILVTEQVHKARELLHVTSVSSTASWINSTIPGIWELDGCGAVVPCKSLWDGKGRKLAVVLIFESPVVIHEKENP